jgi:septum formation protein
MKKIVLASASPRRKEILQITGLKFSVCVSEYQENLGLALPPRRLACFLSFKKAETVALNYQKSLIIAADTFIVLNDKILGKPRNANDAEKMLKMLSGKAHSVITGFSIIDTDNSKKLSRSVETKVYFNKLEMNEIRAYVQSKEPLDKAGAYAIQGLGGVFIKKIEGDYFNVVGLPLSSLAVCLKKFGVYVFS